MKGKISLVDAFAVATVLWEHFTEKGGVTCKVFMAYGFGPGSIDSMGNPLPPDDELVAVSMITGHKGEEKIRIMSKNIGVMEICMLNGMTLWVRENTITEYKHSEKKNELVAVAHGVLNRLIFEGVWDFLTEN